MTELSHLDGEGRARMIDVGAKPVTRRVAVAGGRLETTAEVIGLVRADGLPKADVLATARIAGIAGAKRTSDLIPLAHLLPLDSVTIEFELGETSIAITATVAVTAKTGVEMEALTAVAIAGLTLHDMVKAVDPGGDARRHPAAGEVGWQARPLDARMARFPKTSPSTARGPAIVIVSSTRVAAGSAEDRTGPLIVDWLRARGYDIDAPVICPDAEIEAAIQDAVAAAPALILTTGGTGIHPGDRTPEATRRRHRARAPRRRGGDARRRSRTSRPPRSPARSPASPARPSS